MTGFYNRGGKSLLRRKNWVYKRNVLPLVLKGLRKVLVICYIWNMALCGAETWKIRKIDLKYLKSFEM
jgi:hypothetical protein